ncbi:MAG: hypothetical protein J5507_05685 [Clostridia bacterium]|nr:hypothetical protein [Clostridia bacterium]
MGKAKNIKTLIIILAIVLVLICSIFAILYFATDTFKSNKKSFNNYISQLDLDSFINLKDILNYEERLLNEAHKSDGKVSIVLGESEGEDLVNEELKFTANSDLENGYASAKIELIQDQEKKLNIDYLKSENLYGLKFEDIVNQYITIDSNNSKELMEKLNITSTEEITEKLKELDYSKEDIEEIIKEVKQIFNKYAKISLNQLPEKNYSKIGKEKITVDSKNMEVDGYKVTIKGEQLIEIIKTCVENAKNDEQISNLINKLKIFEEISFSDYQKEIEQLGLMFDDTKQELLLDLNISLYKQGKDLVKVYVKIENSEQDSNSYIELSIENNKSIKLNVLLDNSSLSYEESTISSVVKNGEYNFSIEKDTTNGQEIGYKISAKVKQNDEEILGTDLLFSRYGKSDSQNVKTEAAFKIASDEVNLDISYINNVSFEEIQQKEEFTEGGYGIINEYSEEQIGNLIRNLTNRIFEKVDKQRSIIGSFLLINDISINQAAENASSAATNMFNSVFSMYEGVQSGTTVKMLISTIEASKQSQPEHTIEYNSIDIDNNETYFVSFEKDSEGYINKINIE